MKSTAVVPSSMLKPKRSKTGLVHGTDLVSARFCLLLCYFDPNSVVVSRAFFVTAW